MQGVGQFGEMCEEKELPGRGALLALKGEASGHESQEHSPLKAPRGEAHSGGGRCGKGPPSRGSRAGQFEVKGREQSRDSWIEFPSVELVPVSEGGREPAKSTGLAWPELYSLAVKSGGVGTTDWRRQTRVRQSQRTIRARVETGYRNPN